MRAGRPSVAIVGATGAAGGTLVRVLAERAFPAAGLQLFASARSAGTRMTTHLGDLEVRALSDDSLRGTDIVFFAAGAATSRRHAPRVAGSGGIAVDKSSAFRMDPNVPLVVPEVNASTLATHRGIIANPNCVAIPLSIVLAPLEREHGVRQVTVATYQAATGAGKGLASELEAQTRDAAAGTEPTASVYPHVLHGNVVPGGWAMEGADTEEEVKVAAETRRVLDRPDLRMSVTTVRVPVAVGHSAAVWVELDGPADPDDIRALLGRSPGILVVDDPAGQRYPTPRDAAGTDDVQVGRIRRDIGRQNGIALFFSVDNLRKGAATNAVQVGEAVLATR
ncbi:MAG TPA: aspartate-semialdehyde dehydrogenase [Candidatus Acidoferrales bacterium]|nr:aspartate-semialdehyde dehydrogenase [Candidatus Acidoferrales bacterium]